MSTYLRDLVARTIGAANVVGPRVGLHSGEARLDAEFRVEASDAHARSADDARTPSGPRLDRHGATFEPGGRVDPWQTSRRDEDLAARRSGDAGDHRTSSEGSDGRVGSDGTDVASSRQFPGGDLRPASFTPQSPAGDTSSAFSTQQPAESVLSTAADRTGDSAQPYPSSLQTGDERVNLDPPVQRRLAPHQPISAAVRRTLPDLGHVDATTGDGRVPRDESAATPNYGRHVIKGGAERASDAELSEDVHGRARSAADIRDAASQRRSVSPRTMEMETRAGADREDVVINVTIGRIEVRPSAPPQSKSSVDESRKVAAPRAELDAYLRGRSEARR